MGGPKADRGADIMALTRDPTAPLSRHDRLSFETPKKGELARYYCNFQNTASDDIPVTGPILEKSMR